MGWIKESGPTCIKVNQKVKWSKKEEKYLKDLVKRNKTLEFHSYINVETWKIRYNLLTWEQISIIINRKHKNNRTAEACRNKYNKEGNFVQNYDKIKINLLYYL